MTTPTVDQLDRYIDLLSEGGVEPADAIEAIWGEPRSKPLTQMVTEFPDGIVIGWDTCAARNGGCGNHVSKCKCKTGPKEPQVFAKWRAESSYPGQGALTVAATPVLTDQHPNSDEPSYANEDDLGRSGNAPADIAKSQVPCVLGKHIVSIEDADQNDDGTYSCFDCQEKGLQRER